MPSSSSSDSSRASSSRSPSPTPSALHPTPNEFQIKLHLRKGQPLIRCRSTKDLPDPPGWDHNVDEETFDDFCGQIRSRISKFNGVSWPANGRPYIQTAHTTPQKRFKVLDSKNLRAKLEKAWRLESRRLNDDSKVFIHIYVYLDVQENSSSAPAPSSSTSSSVDNRNGTLAKKETKKREATSTVAAGKKRKVDPSSFEVEEYRTIRIKVEGVVIPIQVELRSLKEALDL